MYTALFVYDRNTISFTKQHLEDALGDQFILI